jgi:superfamily I DNA/RNA helicase
MQITDEQAHAISAFKSGAKNLIVSAYAGTGKTSTLGLISESAPGKKGAYLAFNKAIANAAGQKMPANVRASTFHALAYRSTRAYERWGSRLNNRLTPSIAASESGAGPIALGVGRVLTTSMVGNAIIETVRRFSSSDDERVGRHHVTLDLEGVAEHEIEFLQESIVKYASRIWQKMLAPGTMPVDHGVYIKAWASSAPRIPADFILFDEAQDADPIMRRIVNDQTHAQRIWVGDPYQQIYEWRGAVNALATIQGDSARLTQSFRFGSEIADAATQFIHAINPGDKPLRGNPGRASTIGGIGTPDAIICRTNASVIKQILAFSGIRPVSTTLGYELVRLADDANRLRDGLKATGPLALFTDWNELSEHAESGAGSDLKTMVELVGKYTPETISGAIRAAINRPMDGAIVVSTVHKAKGLEWSSVLLDGSIAESLERANDIHDEHYSKENADAENRIGYVAVTRAINRLSMPGVMDALKVSRGEDQVAESGGPR